MERWMDGEMEEGQGKRGNDLAQDDLAQDDLAQDDLVHGETLKDMFVSWAQQYLGERTANDSGQMKHLYKCTHLVCGILNEAARLGLGVRAG